MLGPSAPEPFDPGLLRRGRDLRATGLEPARDGAWLHVRHGVWVPAASWAGLTPEQRHAALVHATSTCLGRDDPVFALSSAAAVWGLPRIDPWPDAVSVLVGSAHRGRGSSAVRPHVGRPDPGTERGGVLVTSPARTVVDLARTGSLANAVAAADHALRHGLCTRDDLVAECAAVAPRVRGRRTAQLVVALADGLAMSPGESLSRVQMFLLNLPRPRLQEKVFDDEGRIGTVDFGWDGVVGEFDGKVKYRVPPGADPEEAGETVWREKNREDRLRRCRRVARWTWAVAMDRQRFGRLLAKHGIHSQPANTWFS